MSPVEWTLGGVVVGWAVAQGVIEVIRARRLKRWRWEEFRAQQDRVRAQQDRARETIEQGTRIVKRNPIPVPSPGKRK